MTEFASVKEKFNELIRGKSVLITGGTGSFGQALVKSMLLSVPVKRIVIFSRDEMKQWEMQKKFKHDSRLRFMIGDIKDLDRLKRALRGVDFVVHAAAMKIVPLAEYNPIEFVNTNINGTINVVNACIDSNVKRMVALSTDKASSPINLYGATKLAADKLCVAGNIYSGKNGCTFSVVRYGNVMGSRGSVIPLFLKEKDVGKLPITDSEMTRFMISLEQAIETVMLAFVDMLGGEIYVRKIPSMKVVDIAKSIAPEATLLEVGIRPGEKLHEQMISEEDSLNTIEYENYFKILPEIQDEIRSGGSIKSGKKMQARTTYASNTNTQWMTKAELRDWIKQNSGEFL